MEIKEQEIRSIVEQAVSRFFSSADTETVSQSEDRGESGPFSELDRLIDAAEKAQYELINMTLQTRL